MGLFSHKAIQEQWASVDYRKNMSIIGLTSKGGHKEIMAIGSYAAGEEGRAEVPLWSVRISRDRASALISSRSSKRLPERTTTEALLPPYCEGKTS